jgi:hypothetical protein
MSVGAIIAIVIAIIVIVAAGVLAAKELRRRALRQRFGAEYDRLVEEKGTREAEAELTERQRRLAGLNIRDLDTQQRAGYARQWAALQERFVDAPGETVRRADELITAVQRSRGYPADDPDQALDAITVDHARAVEGYREARNMTAGEDEVSTEEYRQAMLQYRNLFTSLVGSPDGIESSPATPAIAARKE